ncbi:MAG: glycosyltransferase involved in cell wall biosynthesis [Flavobacteriaceae bacterium]|uniref:glycosyltransferase family 4 protein n=1 Tax=Candidatus Marifrigoribacter sp. Uisw_064 TaxID=3230970 RepID=UPI003ADD4903
MKKKILYIGNKLSKSGSNVTLIETLGNFLKGEGYKLITSSTIKNKALRLLEMLLTTLFYSKKTSIVLIDTYSTQNFYYAVLVAKICRVKQVPYIPILHGGNLPDRLKRSPKLSNKLFNGAKVNVAPSMYLYESFTEAGYANLKYIPNTIEIKNYDFLVRKEVKAKLLWVRSFSEIYNPTLAIKIVELLIKKGVPVSLCMVGPEVGGLLEECKREVEKKNLPITFTGKLSKEKWIDLSKQYDIFINTTNFDNTPVSVIEGMALGLPVISTNVGGIPFLIENNATGILVEPKDEHLFVEKILHLINHPLASENLSVNARKLVETFDWQKVKTKWDVILSE